MKRFFSSVFLAIMIIGLVAIPVAAETDYQQYGIWEHGTSGVPWNMTVFSNYSNVIYIHSATVINARGVTITSGWVSVSSTIYDLNATASTTAYFGETDYAYYNCLE